MRRFALASLGVIVLAACSGGGTASSTPPQSSGAGAAVNSSSARFVAPANSVRRPANAGCTSVGSDSFIGGTDSNFASATDTAVLGGSFNSVCNESSSIGGGFQNLSSGSFGWIGAGYDNTISSNGLGSAIDAGTGNTSGGAYSFIGSGADNAVNGESSVVVGGEYNSATGEDAAIGGGYDSTASGEWATVAGGNTNLATGNASNVAGGANNTASGQHATVLGGSKNTASGNQSLAAGVNSNAATTGSFVWSDDASNATQLSSTEPDQFLARATGGFTFWTNAANTVGARLAPGSGAWASASDRNMKTDIVALDDAQILDRVGQLPVSAWSYKTERGVRHVGPMAQDFYAAFNVGEDDRHITSIDEDGVALAAIKALRKQNADLKTEVTVMNRRFARLELAVERMQHTR